VHLLHVGNVLSHTHGHGVNHHHASGDAHVGSAREISGTGSTTTFAADPARITRAVTRASRGSQMPSSAQKSINQQAQDGSTATAAAATGDHVYRGDRSSTYDGFGRQPSVLEGFGRQVSVLEGFERQASLLDGESGDDVDSTPASSSPPQRPVSTSLDMAAPSSDAVGTHEMWHATAAATRPSIAARRRRSNDLPMLTLTLPTASSALSSPLMEPPMSPEQHSTV